MRFGAVAVAAFASRLQAQQTATSPAEWRTLAALDSLAAVVQRNGGVLAVTQRHALDSLASASGLFLHRTGIAWVNQALDTTKAARLLASTHLDALEPVRISIEPFVASRSSRLVEMCPSRTNFAGSDSSVSTNAARLLSRHTDDVCGFARTVASDLIKTTSRAALAPITTTHDTTVQLGSHLVETTARPLRSCPPAPVTSPGQFISVSTASKVGDWVVDLCQAAFELSRLQYDTVATTVRVSGLPVGSPDSSALRRLDAAMNLASVSDYLAWRRTSAPPLPPSNPRSQAAKPRVMMQAGLQSSGIAILAPLASRVGLIAGGMSDRSTRGVWAAGASLLLPWIEPFALGMGTTGVTSRWEAGAFSPCRVFGFQIGGVWSSIGNAPAFVFGVGFDSFSREAAPNRRRLMRCSRNENLDSPAR